MESAGRLKERGEERRGCAKEGGRTGGIEQSKNVLWTNGMEETISGWGQAGWVRRQEDRRRMEKD